MWSFLESVPALKKISHAVTTACSLVNELGSGQWRKERVMELAMEIWEDLDPTPNSELDDELVEKLLSWLVDAAVEVMNEKDSLKDTKLS